MEAILVSDVRKLLDGQLFAGDEDWFIQNAIIHKRHKFDRSHNLIFLFKKDKIYWGYLKNFAPCVVVTDKGDDELRYIPIGTTVIRVKSVVQAYWKFVDYYRNLFTIPVVAITGTCGKTTTKEMIKHIVSASHRIQATESSINEPRRSFPYLMGIDRQTDMAVFELGLGNTGNVKHQCLIYQPTIGIITTIGAHHLDGCKTLDGYIQAKGEIVEGLKPNGTLILNRDDENSKKISLENFTGKILYFSVNSQADFMAENIRFAENGMAFTLLFNEKKYQAFVPGYGEHQVYNALAAMAAVVEMGLKIETVIERLKSFTNMKRHLEISQGIHNSTVVDDTWTINPTSIEAALKVIEEIGKGKRKILLLGDINRLGDYEKQYHQKVGTMVAQGDFDALITIGEKAEEIGRQAQRDHFSGEVHMFRTIEGVEQLLRNKLDSNTILLIKGPMKSRSMIELAANLKVMTDE